MSAAKVLVIDDSELALSWVKNALEEEGYEVVTHTQALGCGALMLRERPDLLLLDVNMPTLRGDDLVELVRSHEALRNTVVLLHSSRPPAELRAITQRCGADGYLEKSNQPKDLVRSVRSHLTRRTWRTRTPEAP